MKIRLFVVSTLLLLVLFGCGQELSHNTQTEYPVIRFVQITDTHLGRSEQNGKLTAKVIDAVNRYPRHIDFMVHTGDVVDDGQYNEYLEDYERIFSAIKMPFYLVAGNNDFDFHASRKLPRSRVEECISNWKEHIGPFMQYEDFPGVRMVAVSTEPLAHGWDEMADEIYNWLETVLADAKQEGLDVLVFTHTPIIRGFYQGEMNSPYPDEVYVRLKSLLNQYRVEANIAGHFHVDEIYYTGDVPVYVCTTTLQGSYRVYEYNPNTNRLSYQTIVVR